MNLRNLALLPRILVGAVLLLLPLSFAPVPAFAQGPYGGYGSPSYSSSGSGYSGGSGYAPSGSGYGSSSTTSFLYMVQPGDTLFGIARRFGVSPVTLANINHLFNPNVIFAGTRLLIPRGNPVPPSQVYVIRFGDTLTGIAIRFHTSVIALALTNNIPNPNLIFAGMRLVIPGGASSVPYSAAPSSPYAQSPGTSGPYAAPPMTMPGMTPAPAPQTAPSVTPPSANGTMMVSLKNLAFNPSAITVPVGTTVMWMNDESSAIPHTVTSGTPNAPSGMFDSGTLNPGQSFQFTFTTPGTFAYFCRIHGAAMTGTVTVTP